MIDFAAKRKAAEDELTGLVGGRDISTEPAKQAIQARRGGFLNGADELIRGIAPTGRAGVKTGELDRRIGKKLDRQKYDMARQKYQQVFNTAYNMAEDAGLDQARAIEYARKIADQQTGFQFAAGEAEKDREHSLKINQLQDEYAQRGVSLQDQYAPSTDYASALTRILVGTGTMIGANYMLNRPKTQPTTTLKSSINGGYMAQLRDMPTSLRERTGRSY